MGLFKKGPDRDELIKQGLAEAELDAAKSDDKKDDELSTGNPKVDIELTKINAQLASSSELRKANSERFSRISEQLGELRGMIVDTNKAMSKVEVAASKSVDLVESVHPEKLMIDVRKQDGKIEALRANIESNDAIMRDIMLEMKKMREQMNFYKGTEQVIKLNDEVKQELANIKKMEAVVERHADKVETIFIEVQKSFTSFEKFNDMVKGLDEGFKKITTDFEKVKAQVLMKEDKKEFVDLLDKFNDFEKHTTNLLTLLDTRYKTVKTELQGEFKRMRNQLIMDIKKVKPEAISPEAEQNIVKEEPMESLPEEDTSGALEKLKNIVKKDSETKE